MKKLPKRVYVKWETDPNDPKGHWLIADETTKSMDDGDRVGVYELVETRTMVVDRKLR